MKEVKHKRRIIQFHISEGKQRNDFIMVEITTVRANYEW